MSASTPQTLPAHYPLTRGQTTFSVLSIVMAGLLLAAFGWRLATRLDLVQWWVPAALASGIVLADFGSGLVHWGADSWGRDDMPVIGLRLLVPFRVHHVNPHDLLRRSFVDANGDVAFVAVIVLGGLFTLPLQTSWGGAAALAGFALCGVGSLTNQIHQWAHMTDPPAPVRLLQRWGLILGHPGHAAHHQRPYDGHYCITTGWCNRPLEAIGFFRRLEALITAFTGARPRQDDREYEARFGTPAPPDFHV